MANGAQTGEVKRRLTGEKVSPAYMAHVVLRTTNKPALVEWYRKVLGAEPIFEDSLLSFVTFDEEHHRLAIVAVDGPASTVNKISTVDHIAYSMASLEDLLNTYVRLKAEGILPVWPIHHGPSISFYYRDPDGNNIELQCDAFPTLAECKRYISESKEFAENNIGIEFDPDAFIEAYETGVPMETILRRGAIEGPKVKPERTMSSKTQTTLFNP